MKLVAGVVVKLDVITSLELGSDGQYMACHDSGICQVIAQPLPNPAFSASSSGNLSPGGTSLNFFRGLTFGVRAQGQTYMECLSQNSNVYSLNYALGTDNFLLGNDVAGLAFGDRGDAASGLTFWEGGKLSFKGGVGKALSYGRRTASIPSFNLAGKGGLPLALGKAAGLTAVEWVSGAAEIKMMTDIGFTGAELIGCAIHQ